MNILKKTSLNVKILNLPTNEDPDSLVQKYGQQGFKEYVAKALTIVEYELELLKRNIDLSQTDGRIRFGNEAIKVLRQLETSVEIDYYSKMVASDTGINQEESFSADGINPQRNFAAKDSQGISKGPGIGDPLLLKNTGNH